MYLLDTNVLSELRRRGRTDPKVAAWADAVHPTDLFLSAITILEIEAGTLMIERRDAAQGAVLRSWIDDKVLPAFDGRILPVDTAVALRPPARAGPSRRARCPDRGNGPGPWLETRQSQHRGFSVHGRRSHQSVGMTARARPAASPVWQTPTAPMRHLLRITSSPSLKETE
jgi:hypothetical protein